MRFLRTLTNAIVANVTKPTDSQLQQLQYFEHFQLYHAANANAAATAAIKHQIVTAADECEASRGTTSPTQHDGCPYFDG